MTSEIAELIAQRDALNEHIARLEQAGRTEAIAKIRELKTAFNLTPAEVTGRAKVAAGRRSLAGSKVATKCRDPASGKTWTGRGVTPAWIAGKDREAYLIARQG